VPHEVRHLRRVPALRLGAAPGARALQVPCVRVARQLLRL